MHRDPSTSWSVYTIGRLGIIDEPVSLSRAQQIDLGPWSGASMSNAFVRLTPQLFSGRIGNAITPDITT
jgi:hypothetical protein